MIILDTNWRNILKKAWSVRLMILAAVLTGAEAIMPYVLDVRPSPWMAVLTFAVIGAAFIARIVAQKDLPN